MAVTTEQLQKQFRKDGFLQTITLYDWIYIALGLLGMGYVYYTMGHSMSYYEVPIFAGAMLSIIAMGVLWKPFKTYILASFAVAFFAVSIYHSKLPQLDKQGIKGRDAITALSVKPTHDPKIARERAQSKTATPEVKRYNFFLTYFVSSKVATMWMSALFFIALACYFLAMLVAYLSRVPDYMYNGFMAKSASALTWSAAVMGTVAWLVRWRESHIVGSDVGHIPVSNLYEVFIVLCVISALLYLYFEGRFKTKALGAWVLLIICSCVAFTIWYHFKGQHRIEGLVPALQSWWMKIHVPANFVGYAAFAISAMISIPYIYRYNLDEKCRLQNKPLVSDGLLPSLQTMDNIMYKSIAFGWMFFSIATALGALWARDAWGAYWQWDPKETWALIVWINYAAWLHFRLIMGVRGILMGVWAIIGLGLTTFAFLGVNIFLSGLHSYGKLT